MIIHLLNKLFFGFIPHSITLGAGKEVDMVHGGASGTSMDRIGEVTDRVNKGQAAGEYEAGFMVRSLARVGARD